MGSSSSKASATGQLAKTILQSGEQAKPCRPSGSLARPGAAPPDETLSLLETAHVVTSNAGAGAEDNDEQQGAQLGRLPNAETGGDGEEINEEESGSEHPTYVAIDLNNPDEWDVFVIKEKVLAALKQSGLNRFDLECFDFEEFDIQVGFDDLESINDRSGSTCTSEQVGRSLEGDDMGVMFPLSARIKITKASEDKPLTPMERIDISNASIDFSKEDEARESFSTSVTLRRLLLQPRTLECKLCLAETLSTLAYYSDSAGRDTLVGAGCAQAVIRCMREGDVTVDEFGCSFLNNVSMGSTERVEAIANAGAGEVLPRILATMSHGYDGAVSRLHCLTCIAALVRVSAAAREAMENAGVVSALLEVAAHHTEAFESCAIALSFYAGDMVEEKRAGLQLSELYELEEGNQMDQVAAAADGMRYGWFSLAKDSLLPLSDVCLDVVNAYTLYVEGHHMWLAAQLAAPTFNGCASALHGAAGGHWVTAAVDLLTFGTAGLVKESYLCFKQGVKSESLITLKLIEACEAGVSLAVTADTIVAAGTLPGYDKLTLGIAVVRCSSLAVSVVSLAATAFDVDKRAVLSRPPCRHLRPMLKSLAVQAAAFAYHVAEVSGSLALVPLIQATRPLGIYVLAGACFVLAAAVHYFGAQSVQGDWITEGDHDVTILDTSLEFSAIGQSVQATVSGASASVEVQDGEVKILELQASGDVITVPLLYFGEFGISPQSLLRPETHRYMKLVPGTTATAGFARGLLVLVTAAPAYMLVNLLGVMGRRFQLAVAALRPVLWLAAWATLGCRAAADEETYRMVTAPGVSAILAVALAGTVAYGPLALHQRSQGRWLHFRQFDEQGMLLDRRDQNRPDAVPASAV